MGIYIYTVRKTVKQCSMGGIATPVALLKFLQRLPRDPDDSLTSARLERARQCWNSLDVKPGYVALGDKFEDRAHVYEWPADAYHWYDCEDKPLGKLVGFIRRVRNGRRVEYAVAPRYYEVVAKYRPPGKGLHSTREYAWDAETARKKAGALLHMLHDVESITIQCYEADTSCTNEIYFETADVGFDRKLRESAHKAGIDWREVSDALTPTKVEVEPGVSPPKLTIEELARFQAPLA